MQVAPNPFDEKIRLNELLSYKVLDSTNEEEFDQLLELASQISDCPTALISFVDKERQWFKSAINIGTKELPRDTSFCGHVINQPDVFIVEDAKNDVRFHDNPNVTGELNSIGFYAGAPIVSQSGFSLGTVCVIDNRPRQLSLKQKEGLAKIAAQVSKLLELRRHRLQNRLLAESIAHSGLEVEKNFEALFNQSSFAKIIFDLGGYKMIDVNEAALKLYGYTREEFLQLTAIDIRLNKSKSVMQRRVEKVENSSGFTTLKAKHITKDGKILNVSITLSKVFHKGKIVRLADITDLTSEHRLQERLHHQKSSAEKKLFDAAIAVKEREKIHIRDALRENINQILASTNLYLDIAKSNEAMRLELIHKSRHNVTEAMEAVKKIYESLEAADDNENFLHHTLGNFLLKFELSKNIHVHNVITGSENKLSEPLRLQLFYIIEEFITTVSKLTKIENIWVNINCNEPCTLLIKTDAVGGKDIETKAARLINSLSAKAKRLNASVEMFSQAGSGFTLKLILNSFTE